MMHDDTYHKKMEEVDTYNQQCVNNAQKCQYNNTGRIVIVIAIVIVTSIPTMSVVNISHTCSCGIANSAS